MKSKFFPALFALPITAGICGAYLHSVQMGYSLGIMSAKITSPASYGFVAICTVALFMSLIAAFILKGGVQFISEKIEVSANISFYVAAVILLVYAGVQLMSLVSKFELITLVLAIFSLYSAVSFMVLGKYNMAKRDSMAYYVFSAVPVFSACFMVIVLFREKSTNPVVYEYIALVMAYLSILIFSYSIAAHMLGKNKRGAAVFSCFIGIFFMIVELASPLFLIGKMQISELYNIKELLPVVAYLILMPSLMMRIIKK